MRVLTLILAFFANYSLEQDCRVNTKGHFYRKITKDSEGGNDADDEPKLNPEFFDCGVKDSCTHVVMFKDTQAYEIVHGEEELKNLKGSISVWEKQVSHGQDMEPTTDWIVIQRRVDASVDFQRNWTEHKSGFGNPAGNFWIGLDKLHDLAGPCKGAVLNITMKHRSYPDKLFYAAYTIFEIGNEADGYRLKIGGYSGNAGNSFASSNGMQFSTYDRDNDNYVGSYNCAATFKGGWWYNACFQANLNVLYPVFSAKGAVYMSWIKIAGSYGNIIKSEMKIRVSET